MTMKLFFSLGKAREKAERLLFSLFCALCSTVYSDFVFFSFFFRCRRDFGVICKKKKQRLCVRNWNIYDRFYPPKNFLRHISCCEHISKMRTSAWLYVYVIKLVQKTFQREEGKPAKKNCFCVLSWQKFVQRVRWIRTDAIVNQPKSYCHAKIAGTFDYRNVTDDFNLKPEIGGRAGKYPADLTTESNSWLGSSIHWIERK